MANYYPQVRQYAKLVHFGLCLFLSTAQIRGSTDLWVIVRLQWGDTSTPETVEKGFAYTFFDGGTETGKRSGCR